MIPSDVADVADQIKAKMGGKMPLDQVMYNLCEGTQKWLIELEALYKENNLLPLTAQQMAGVFKLMIHSQAETLANFVALQANGVDMSACMETSPKFVTNWIKDFLK